MDIHSKCLRWSLVLLCFTASTGMAQHAMHDMAGAEDIELQTMPTDDAVMGAAPESIMLHFGPAVRLVKLALRNAESDILDIGFRYNPAAGREFMQPLPTLGKSDYHTVEWAVLDDVGTLIKGDFHFSFGEDARPPSYWLDQMEEMRHIMAPDYRLLNPSSQ